MAGARSFLPRFAPSGWPSPFGETRHTVVCTIVVLSRVHPDAGLVALANRDEFYDRLAEPPQILDEDAGVVGGRDVAAGGTWMGATRGGFFVGLTNQRTWGGADRALVSRGTVALEALKRGSVDGVRALLAEVEPSDYNPFNLIYGDHQGVDVAYAGREGIERHALSPGIHVLTNDRMGSPDFPKADRARVLAEKLAPLGVDWPRVQGLLADHALPDADALPDPPSDSIFTAELIQRLQALCIHTPLYGTRSATAIVSDGGEVLDYRFADGPPCQAPLTSVRHLFAAAVG